MWKGSIRRGGGIGRNGGWGEKKDIPFGCGTAPETKRCRKKSPKWK